MALVLKELPWNLWIIGSSLIAIFCGMVLSNKRKHT